MGVKVSTLEKMNANVGFNANFHPILGRPLGLSDWGDIIDRWSIINHFALWSIFVVDIKLKWSITALSMNGSISEQFCSKRYGRTPMILNPELKVVKRQNQLLQKKKDSDELGFSWLRKMRKGLVREYGWKVVEGEKRVLIK